MQSSSQIVTVHSRFTIHGDACPLSYVNVVKWSSVTTITNNHPFSNKIPNDDVLVPAYVGCPGKCPLNRCHVECRR